MKLLSILGPTASGKSAVAIALARRLNGEVVSCDSMQIYRDLDIGTAKVTREDVREIPHHLIDIRDMSERFSVAEFIMEADGVIRECIARGRQPILCGGTGLYAKALLYGFDFRPRKPEVAAELRQEFETNGPDALLAELEAAYPDIYRQTKDNPRHWLRALEVIRITGEPPTKQQEFEPPDYVVPEYILTPSPELSRARIRKRTEDMLASGWIEEVKAIGSDRFRASATAGQAIGYALILDYLEGKLNREQLVDRIAISTAQFAKRQRTWFRNQHSHAIVIPVEEGDDVESLANNVLTRWQG